MRNKQIKILVLNNNFLGSYQSNQVFFDEIICAFKNLNIQYFIADTIDKAKNHYLNSDIDFSISFSKYFYYDSNNIPLYDFFKIPHYQWVSDNPVKMNLDEESKWINYIFIDKEFELSVKYLQNKPIILPIGFLKSNRLSLDVKKKIDAVLVPCKIRSLEMIATKIDNNPKRIELRNFLKNYDYSSSFILYFQDFCKRHPGIDEDFFRLVNEYIRVKKRVDAVNSIVTKEIFIVGKDYGNFNSKKNVTFIDKINYSDINKTMNNFKYVLNIDPNYHACVHDRVIKSINSGTICITNASNVFNYTLPYVYSFNNLDKINLLFNINNTKYDNVLELQQSFTEDFEWSKSIKKIINHFSSKR